MQNYIMGILTSVARLWLALLARRKRTTLSWFSCAAMYSGVNPFWLCMFTRAWCCTNTFTISSWPAVGRYKRVNNVLPVFSKLSMLALGAPDNSLKVMHYEIMKYSSTELNVRGTNRETQCGVLCCPSWLQHRRWRLAGATPAPQPHGLPCWPGAAHWDHSKIKQQQPYNTLW